MGMIGDFEYCLLDLQIFSNDSIKTEAILRRMFDFFKGEETDFTIDLMIFLAMGENGIMTFITKMAFMEPNKHNIYTALDLIKYLLDHFEKFCIPYVDDIRKMCLYLTQCDIGAKMKENSLKLLKCLFRPSFIIAIDIASVVSTVKGQLSRHSDMPPTVQEQLLSVLGVSFEKAPEFSQKEKEWFLTFFTAKMKDSGKNASRGCFEALYGYLMNFDVTEETTVEFLYSCIKKCNAKNIWRRGINRWSLKIIKDHYRFFLKQICNDIDYWDGAFSVCLEKTGEDKQLGFGGIVSCYKAVAQVMNSAQIQPYIYEADVLVERLLEKGNLASLIGMVELVSTGCVTAELSHRTLQMVMKRAVTSARDNYMYLPVNLECISKYLSKKTVGNEAELMRVHGLAVSLIDNYPRMTASFQKYAHKALEMSFYHMACRGRDELNEYAKGVIYQGLIRSCSYRLSTDSELHKEITGKEMVSHKSFLPLWIHIINIASSDTGAEGSESKIDVAIKIFDEYLTSFLKINHKLDLTIHLINPNLTDPEVCYEAERPEDFQIFVNNVNIFIDVLQKLNDLHMVKKWLSRIFTEAVGSSYKAPLVSGFYKIVTAAFKVAEKLNFFEESDRNETTMIQRFLQDVSIKVGKYKGDLQISCLQVLLSAPVCLIRDFVVDLIPVLKVILRVGTGHLPLLGECIETLERWYRDLPKDSVEYLLSEVLPYFDLFLQSKGFGNMNGHLSTVNMKTLPRRDLKTICPREDNSQLLILQRRFMYFLGGLNQDVCKKIACSNRKDEQVDKYYKMKEKLLYDLPLTDMKLRLHLEEWLPRVIHLSLSSTDRHTRIAACEFLHSMVSLTLGRMKQMNGELNGLFRKLVSACLALGCESDLVILQLYEPLAKQMVHYFADKRGDFSEKEIFMSCLMEGVSDPDNSSLRDFSVELIREFTQWSLKDLTVEKTTGAPNNIDALLRSIYSLAVHTDHNKRCGAATVFNNIYSLIREEATILYSHWFMLYYYFMECLNMCKPQDDSTHILKAIEHIKRPLSDKYFTETSTSRKIPPGFNGNTLNSLLEWTFARCKQAQVELRQLSMSLIQELVGSSGQGCTVKGFILSNLKDIIHMPVRYLKENIDGDSYLEWLKYCSAFFDYYNWLLLNDVVKEEDLVKTGMDSWIPHFTYEVRLGSNRFRTQAVASTTAFVIVQVLKFMLTSFNCGIDSYIERILGIIKDCLWRPSIFHFELFDRDNRERLSDVLTELIPILANKIRGNEWKCFFDLGSFSSDLLDLGRLDQSFQSLTLILEPVGGLRILRNLKLWDAIDACRINSGEMIKGIFESIFTHKHKRDYSVVIETQDVLLLKEALDFFLNMGQSMDTVANLLSCKDQTTKEETFENITKGEYFFELFKDELLKYFIGNSGASFDLIRNRFPNDCLHYVTEMMKHASQLDLSLAEKSKLVSDFCGIWYDLLELSRKHDQMHLLLSSLRVACNLYPEVLVKETYIGNRIIRTIKDSNVSLKEFELLVDVLPYLCTINEETNDSLSNCLNELLEMQKLGGSKCDSHCRIVLLYNALLSGFKRTRSLPILRHSIRMLSYSKDVISEKDIISVLSHICQMDEEKLPQKHLTKMLSFLYEELFVVESSNEVCRGVLLEMLRSYRSDVSWAFTLEKLEDLVRLLKIAGNVKAKISALEMIQTCVVRVRRSDLECLPPTLKNAFQNLMRICSEHREIRTADTPEESELHRSYACSCFNTLCTIITAKTDNPFQYRCIIFKNEFSLLSGLIRRDKPYTLSMDFDELPKKRKILTKLRKSITMEKTSKFSGTLSSIKYACSQTLFDSSLREDVTKFDFSTSIVEPTGSATEEGGNGIQVELEIDCINTHECMPTIVGIIEHMVDLNITPVVDNAEEPFWLKSIMFRLRSYDSTENEKIFIFKLICNIEKYVKPYARKIILDVLDKILEVFQDKPINYLVMDIISIIIGWNINLEYLALKQQLTRLCLYIINKSDSFRKDIIKSNLELAKLIIETCRNGLNLKQLSIDAFERLKSRSRSDAEKYINLQYCGMLLANSIPVWTESTSGEFFSLLLRHIRSDVKHSKLAAEICGLGLKCLDEEQSEDLSRYMDKVCTDLRQYLSETQGKDISLIYAVHKHFPKISASFLGTAQLCAWNMTGPYGVHCLEMILNHAEDLKNKLDPTFGNFLTDMLSSKDSAIFDLTLQIIERILDGILRKKEMRRILTAALALHDCKSRNVRKLVYDLAARLTDELEKDSPDITRLCRIVLLMGMNDTDTDLSQRCLGFWYDRIRGFSSTERFSEAVNELYEPEMETSFLNFAARLMIRWVIDSPEYGNTIFEHPLREDYSAPRSRNIIKTNYRGTMAPLFAPTLASTLNRSETCSLEPSMLGESNFSRKNLSFLPTLQQNPPPEEIRKAPKRFVRNPKYFAKKGASRGDEEKSQGDECVILREYRDSVYPDIQITHADLLKPLEVLTKRDPQMGRRFLVSLYEGFSGRMTASESSGMYERLRNLMQKVLEKSGESDHTVIAFLFHILLKCEGRLEVNPEAITKFAKSSGWLSIGTLILEDMILRAEGAEEGGSGRRLEISPDEKRWLYLAELYRSSNEFQVLHSIFLEKLRIVGNAGEAIRCESDRDWKKASELYLSVLTSPSRIPCKHYVNAYFTCLARLSDWSTLNTYIRRTYTLNDLWTDQHSFDVVLPWYLSSQMMKSLVTGDNSLMELIRQIKRDKEAELQIKKLFFKELSVAHFSSGDLKWSNYYLQEVCLNFLSDWSHWDKWSNGLRETKLLLLPLMSELQQSLSVLGEKNDSKKQSKVVGMAQMWRKNYPQETDDLLYWDVKLTCRGRFLSSLCRSCPGMDMSEILPAAISSEFAMVKSSLSQHNISLADVYLKRIDEKLQGNSHQEYHLMQLFFRSSVEVQRASKVNFGDVGGFEKLLDAISNLRNEVYHKIDEGMTAHGHGQSRFLVECYTELSSSMKLLSSMVDKISEPDLHCLAFRLRAPYSKSSIRNDTGIFLKMKELQYLDDAVQVIQKTTEKDVVDMLPKIYFRMAQYYRRNGGYDIGLALCLFRSMKFGNLEARKLFCCLLTQPEMAKDWLRDEQLKSEYSAVPVWMFLMWTNQLTANLDSEMFPFVKDLLLRLVEEYPNAVRYSFALSKETYQFQHSEYGSECRRFVEDLSQCLLSDTFHLDFLTALTFVASPDLIVGYHLGKILDRISCPEPDWEWVHGALCSLRSRMFHADYGRFRGKLFDGLAHIEPKLEDLSKQLRNPTLWKEKIALILMELNKMNLHHNILKSYCPWLHNFHAISAGDRRIEVPGQYDGEQRPIPKYHVTISSFKYSVLVMNSKCRPIRICILGSDTREYKFLVKFGEDLRQDQRIQQIFKIMNSVLRCDLMSAEAIIDTYKVIPLTCHTGLIEWVSNTTSLFELCTKSDSEVRSKTEKVQQEHLKFLGGTSALLSPHVAHLNGYLNISRDKAICRFEECVHSFEWDLLRNAFCQMSWSPEEFAYLRRSFAVSYATICIAHWTIGIGDRHLDNTLVSSKTGRALGIDFGCAFGFATEFLTPPELIPFRLTPQIINLMRPMGENGLIKETMIQCLSSFRRDGSVLLAAMEVFALEPALDWLEKAGKNRDFSNATLDVQYGRREWSARRKVEMVKERLNGINPVKTFRDDLVTGHSGSKYLVKYLEVLEDGAHIFHEESMSERRQVECLINLACNRHILSKTYVGWNPWL